MARIETLLVVTGSEQRCALNDERYFDTTPLHVNPGDANGSLQENFVGRVLDFADIPRHFVPFIVRQFVAIASSMGDEVHHLREPKLVAIIEDASLDGADLVTKLMRPILTHKGWRAFALQHGVVVCLLTDRAESLGLRTSTTRTTHLLLEGIDLILPGRASPAVVAAEVTRRFALLSRQARWSAASQWGSWKKTLWAFILFALTVAVVEQCVDRAFNFAFGTSNASVPLNTERDS